MLKVKIVDDKIHLTAKCERMYLPLPDRNFGFIFNIKNRKIMQYGDPKMVRDFYDKYKTKMVEIGVAYYFEVTDDMVTELNLFLMNNNRYEEFVNKLLEKKDG